jgi:hypothetical protein
MAKKKDADVLSDDLTASSFSKPRSGKTFGSFDRQLARGMALCTRFYRVDKSLGIYNEKSSRVNYIKALKVISKFFFSVDKKKLRTFKNPGLLIFGEFEVLYNPKMSNPGFLNVLSFFLSTEKKNLEITLRALI